MQPFFLGFVVKNPVTKKLWLKQLSAIPIMINDLEDEIKESDANPVLVYEEGMGLKVADARIILKKK